MLANHDLVQPPVKFSPNFTLAFPHAELLLACAALNRMTHLGMPDSYALNF